MNLRNVAILMFACFMGTLMHSCSRSKGDTAHHTTTSSSSPTASNSITLKLRQTVIAMKRHTGGSAWFPGTIYASRVKVPSGMIVISGYGSNDFQAATVVIDDVVTCKYSPTSTTNNPSRSSTSQKRDSLEYKFRSCDDGSTPGDWLDVDRQVVLNLNKADSKIHTVTIKAEMDTEIDL